MACKVVFALFSLIVVVVVAVCGVVAFGEQANVNVLYEATNLKFQWDSKEQENQAKESGAYKPENCAAAGVKMYKDNLYLTIPRWKSGVPATLVKVGRDNVLLPFPSADFQDTKKGGFGYVQSMEIDSKGRMWVLDTARQNIFEEHPIDATPRLVILDLNSLTPHIPVHIFQFPADVASPSTSFINDIMVDDKNDIAYISEAGSGTDGAILVYKLNTNTASRVTHHSMKFNNDLHYSVDGIDMNEFKIPIDGIALSPDGSRVYYNALLGNRLYSVATSALLEGTITDAEVADHGEKVPSDGLAFADNGKLYFGSLPGHSVLEWVPGTPLDEAKIVYENVVTMKWPDTFGFDGKGNLLVLSNRLHQFVKGTMDWAGDANFRVVAIAINANSYVNGPAPVELPPGAPVVIESPPLVLDAPATVVVADGDDAVAPAPVVTEEPVATVAETVKEVVNEVVNEVKEVLKEIKEEIVAATTSTSAPTSTPAPTSTSTPTPTSSCNSSCLLSTTVSAIKAYYEKIATKACKFTTNLKNISKDLGKQAIQLVSVDVVEFATDARAKLQECVKNTTQCRATIKQIYRDDALYSAYGLCLISIVFCYVVSLISGDLSIVDRLWSILPMVYVLHFLSYNWGNTRLVLMSAFIGCWGLRLSYNFYRKGGYTSVGEDYRWVHVRKLFPNPVFFHLFNFLFVAVLQNILLFSITLPAYAVLNTNSPISWPDVIACFGFAFALLLETWADEQQWTFQQSKQGLTEPVDALAADYENGFLSSGLFSFSRHPNFFAEQCIWVIFAIFSVIASGKFLLWAWAGSFGLILLFHFSTNFTEKLSVAKYPAYAVYQNRVSRLWPTVPKYHAD